MRKNILALSIATMIGGLGFAGGASANIITAATGVNVDLTLPTAPTAETLKVNTDGIGHFLVIPYYTVQNGNATLINLVNTDQTFGKAVKVRFRGAANSDDVFDFQVFLSPGDVWTAMVSQAADGRAQLATADKSCTLPASVNQAFVLDRLPSSYTPEQKAAQTREGYVEIFNMGDIPKGRYTAQAALDVAVTDNPLYAAIKHVNGVAPCTSAALDRTSVDPLTHNNAAVATNAAYQGLALPTTGLAANYTIINVPGANTWTAAATAIEARENNPSPFAAGPAAVGNIVFHPQTNEAVADAVLRTTDPLLAGGFDSMTSAGGPGVVVAAPVSASMFDFPDLSTPYTIAATPVTQAVLITAALAVTSVKNEYLTDPAISAETDWVFSSPTRRYSVGLDYSTAPFSRVFADLGAAPETYFYTGNTSFNASLGQICVLNVTPSYYDREEQTPTPGTGFVISPGAPADPLSFCGEVSVLSFNNTAGTSVLSASLTRKDIDLNYNDGWMTIATPGNGGIGLPILGGAYMNAFNGNARDGLAGNYGLTFGHRYTRP